MNWTDAVLWTAFIIGAAAAGFIFARRPSFWIEFGMVMAKKLWPLIWAYVSKRKSPEDEAKWRDQKKTGEEPNRPKHR